MQPPVRGRYRIAGMSVAKFWQSQKAAPYTSTMFKPQGVKSMFDALKKRIFGVAELPTVAAQPQPAYLPESQVPTGGIEGVADDGSCWEAWRVDPHTGEQWYQRTSEIRAIASTVGDDADDADDFEQEDLETKVYDAQKILRDARYRLAQRQLESRNQAFPFEDDHE